MRGARNRRGHSRSGKIMVMTAVLMPTIMGFMALCVDLSVVATGQAQLELVSDAAALSGAMQLADENRVRGAGSSSSQAGGDLTEEMDDARTRAIAVAQANRVLTAVPVLYDNSSNSATGDIVIGYFDPRSRQWSPPPLSDKSKMNAVLVNAARSADHGGVIPAFFSRVWGYKGSTVHTQSIATAQNYPVQGFKIKNQLSIPLLPIVLDVNTYTAMMTGQTTDQYTYDEASDTVSTGPDNIDESVLYPVASGQPGNWGTINVGVSDNSTSTLSSQILNGISPTQLATFPNSTIALSNSTSPPSITFSGNPGISAALKSPLENIIGEPVVIPIYDQTTGDGNNATYRVIAFQPARILAVNFQGNNKYVIIQPCLIKDPTIIPMTDTSEWPTWWSWQSGGVVRVHLVR